MTISFVPGGTSPVAVNPISRPHTAKAGDVPAPGNAPSSGPGSSPTSLYPASEDSTPQSSAVSGENYIPQPLAPPPNRAAQLVAQVRASQEARDAVEEPSRTDLDASEAKASAQTEAAVSEARRAGIVGDVAGVTEDGAALSGSRPTSDAAAAGDADQGAGEAVRAETEARLNGASDPQRGTGAAPGGTAGANPLDKRS